MQLIAPTPMKAARHARSASPSSERRTPATADINSGLFQRGTGRPNHAPGKGVPYLFLGQSSIDRANLNGRRVYRRVRCAGWNTPNGLGKRLNSPPWRV